jgi:uncharacterized protein with von Willebrand factor type A (vWA) domain
MKKRLASAPLTLPQLTAAQFNAALRDAGFGVDRARIIDASGRCYGFVTTPVFRGKGVIDRNKTLAKVIRERDAEIARRALTALESKAD